MSHAFGGIYILRQNDHLETTALEFQGLFFGGLAIHVGAHVKPQV